MLLGVYDLEMMRASLDATVQKFMSSRQLGLRYSIVALDDTGRVKTLASTSNVQPELAQFGGSKVTIQGAQSLFCARGAGRLIGVCFATDSADFYRELSRFRVFIVSAILLSLAVFGVIAAYLTRNGVRLVRVILQKLEDLSRGDYSKLNEFGPAESRRYIKVANSIVDRIDSYRRIHEEDTRLVAVGRTAQALAHDVRKPFDTIRATLDLLGSAESDESLRAVAKRCIPEVQRVLASVNGMIEDVMETCNDSLPTAAAVAPEVLILRSLQETFFPVTTGNVTLGTTWRTGMSFSSMRASAGGFFRT